MNAPGLNEHQLHKMKTQPGFVAALDQSGGSTPKALAAYGIKEGAWSNEDEMFGIVHQMRTRVITGASFTGERILGAILFENTMDRDIQGQPTADYLWNVKRVVPFLKSDTQFNAVLEASIQSIFQASTVKQLGWQQGKELKAA